MNRKGWTLLATVCTLIAVAVFAQGQEDVFSINNKTIFMRKTRAAVTFPHALHQGLEEFSCLDCHHRYENGKNVREFMDLEEGNETIRCAYCHRGGKELQNAYHSQCIGCHERSVRQGKPSGPRLCGECHSWKK